MSPGIQRGHAVRANHLECVRRQIERVGDGKRNRGACNRGPRPNYLREASGRSSNFPRCQNLKDSRDHSFQALIGLNG